MTNAARIFEARSYTKLWVGLGSKGRLHATAARPSARVANATPGKDKETSGKILNTCLVEGDRGANVDDWSYEHDDQGRH